MTRSFTPSSNCTALIFCLLASASLLAQDPEADANEKPADLPLEPTRTVAFETDEGTWLSLDLSPDGRTIVFELLGDLYQLPSGGGQASAITSGMAFDSQPVYSPDGKSIAFLSDRSGSQNLWIANTDGSDPRAITKDPASGFASPHFSADGDYLFVSKAGAMGASEVWMYHINGGSGVQITQSAANPALPPQMHSNALGAEVSPDGRYLYYATRMGGFSYNARFPLWTINRRDLRSGDDAPLIEAAGSAMRPALSPDGQWLAYATRYETQTGLRLRNLQTGEDRWLIYPVERDDQESRGTRDLLPGYTFTPDGRAILIPIGGKIQRVDVASGTATEVSFSAQVEQALGPRLNFPMDSDSGPVRSRIVQNPTQSPDGDRVAFSTLGKLYTQSLPDGTAHRLTSGDQHQFQPAWSPDGRWLAYVTLDGGEGHIWKTRANGQGKPRRLSGTPAFYSDPVWSPDGENIVALRGSSYARRARPLESPMAPTPGLDVIMLPADGGTATLVTHARGQATPHFGPEVDRIYLYSVAGLVSVRLDGSDQRSHLVITGNPGVFGSEPAPAYYARMSPDGRWALAFSGNQLHLVAVPPVGKPQTINVALPSVAHKQLSTIGADYIAWADGGATATWAVGSTFFRRAIDSIDFQPPAPGPDEQAETEAAIPAEAAPKPEPYTEPDTESFEIAVEVPRHIPRGTVVLRGARVITMNGDEVLEDADLVVVDNKISRVGPRGEVTPEATVIDVRGKTIVPGFIDTHAHWMEVRRGILDMENWSFLANLAYGVTAGLDVQAFTNDAFAYKDLTDAGEIIGLRAYATGPGVFKDNAFKSKEHVLGVLTKYRDHYRTRNIKAYMSGTRQQRQWIAQVSRDLKIIPTTEGGLDLRMDLTHAIDGLGGTEHSLPIVPLYKDVVELVAQSGMGYTPTLLVAYGGPWAEEYFYTTTEVHDNAKLNRFTPHDVIDAKTKRRQWFRPEEHVFTRIAAQATKIIRAGGRVGVGSHGQLQGLGYHWELWALASGGMTTHEALRAATLHGAEIIGRSAEMGSIEAGKFADLVIMDANPLDAIENTNTIRYVMKNGELFEGDTLDQVWPEQKPLPPLYFWDDGPPTDGG